MEVGKKVVRKNPETIKTNINLLYIVFLLSHFVRSIMALIASYP